MIGTLACVVVTLFLAGLVVGLVVQAVKAVRRGGRS